LLAVLKRSGEVRHFEVETYGWGILPRSVAASRIGGRHCRGTSTGCSSGFECCSMPPAEFEETDQMSAHPSQQPAYRVEAQRHRRAVGPRLRVLLHVLFALLALTGANSVYLASITLLNFLYRDQGVSYENWFYFLMFLGHVLLGLW
jgi:hypothetical protein